MLSGSLAGTIVSPSQRTAAWKMDEPQPKRQGQKRPKRPRIDIDEQIEDGLLDTTDAADEEDSVDLWLLPLC